jgi:polyferredoxin
MAYPKSAARRRDLLCIACGLDLDACGIDRDGLSVNEAEWVAAAALSIRCNLPLPPFDE